MDRNSTILSAVAVFISAFLMVMAGGLVTKYYCTLITAAFDTYSILRYSILSAASFVFGIVVTYLLNGMLADIVDSSYNYNRICGESNVITTLGALLVTYLTVVITMLLAEYPVPPLTFTWAYAFVMFNVMCFFFYLRATAE